VAKKGEMMFVKHWRVGEINLNFTVTGFGKIVNIPNQSLTVPSFQKAYKIGSSAHLVKKLVAHLVKSLMSCGLEIIRDRFALTKSPVKKSKERKEHVYTYNSSHR